MSKYTVNQQQIKACLESILSPFSVQIYVAFLVVQIRCKLESVKTDSAKTKPLFLQVVSFKGVGIGFASQQSLLSLKNETWLRFLTIFQRGENPFVDVHV